MIILFVALNAAAMQQGVQEIGDGKTCEQDRCLCQKTSVVTGKEVKDTADCARGQTCFHSGPNKEIQCEHVIRENQGCLHDRCLVVSYPDGGQTMVSRGQFLISTPVNSHGFVSAYKHVESSQKLTGNYCPRPLCTCNDGSFVSLGQPCLPLAPGTQLSRLLQFGEVAQKDDNLAQLCVGHHRPHHIAWMYAPCQPGQVCGAHATAPTCVDPVAPSSVEPVKNPDGKFVAVEPKLGVAPLSAFCLEGETPTVNTKYNQLFCLHQARSSIERGDICLNFDQGCTCTHTHKYRGRKVKNSLNMRAGERCKSSLEDFFRKYVDREIVFPFLKCETIKSCNCYGLGGELLEFFTSSHEWSPTRIYCDLANSKYVTEAEIPPGSMILSRWGLIEQPLVNTDKEQGKGRLVL